MWSLILVEKWRLVSYCQNDLVPSKTCVVLLARNQVTFGHLQFSAVYELVPRLSSTRKRGWLNPDR